MRDFAIGVDVGGTNLRVAAIDTSGEIFERINLSTEVRAGRDVVLEEMVSAVQVLRAKHASAARLIGIGFGVPGLIHMKEGKLRESPNLPGWHDYPLRDTLEQRLGTRVILENDANAAALGEKWIGHGRGVDSLIMLTLGTGVGGGIVLDGRIWHGMLGMAGELGHITVDPNGPRCNCGNHGCLEALASATAIVRMAKEAIAGNHSPALKALAATTNREITSALVYEAAKDGDPAAQEIFRTVGWALGVALAGLVNAFNVPMYVLMGGVAAAWDLFAPPMLAEVERRSFVYRAGGTRIVLSELGADAGLYGAAYLGLQA
jgi:glucokinase